MSYNDLKSLRLGWMAVQEMNQSGNGTDAQQYCLAMAWQAGYAFAHGDDAEAKAELELEEWKKFPGAIRSLERFESMFKKKGTG